MGFFLVPDDVTCLDGTDVETCIDKLGYRDGDGVPYFDGEGMEDVGVGCVDFTRVGTMDVLIE